MRQAAVLALAFVLFGCKTRTYPKTESNSKAKESVLKPVDFAGYKTNWQELKLARQQAPGYDPSQAPFKVGDKVSWFYRVKDNEGTPQLVNDRSAPQLADSFTLSKQETSNYLPFVGETVYAELEITKILGKPNPSANNFSYEVKIGVLRSNGNYNPTDAELKAFKPGTEVTIEGSLTEFANKQGAKVTLPIAGDPGGKSASIDVGGGRTIKINLETSYPIVDSAVSAFMDVSRVLNTPFEEGDLVKVSTRVTRTGGLTAFAKNNFTLVEPSDRRKLNSEKVSKDFNFRALAIEETIKQGDYQGARANYALARMLPISHQELTKLLKLFENMPKNERPILLPHRTEIPVLDNGFGVRFEAMNQSSFLEFVSSWAKYEKKPKLRFQQPYLYRVLRDLDLLQLESTQTIVKQATSTFLDAALSSNADESAAEKWTKLWNFEMSLDSLDSSNITSLGFIFTLSEKLKQLGNQGNWFAIGKKLAEFHRMGCDKLEVARVFQRNKEFVDTLAANHRHYEFKVKQRECEEGLGL